MVETTTYLGSNAQPEKIRDVSHSINELAQGIEKPFRQEVAIRRYNSQSIRQQLLGSGVDNLTFKFELPLL